MRFNILNRKLVEDVLCSLKDEERKKTSKFTEIQISEATVHVFTSHCTLETLPVPVKQNVTGPIDLGMRPMEISYPQSLTAWMAWLTFL